MGFYGKVTKVAKKVLPEMANAKVAKKYQSGEKGFHEVPCRSMGYQGNFMGSYYKKVPKWRKGFHAVACDSKKTLSDFDRFLT